MKQAVQSLRKAENRGRQLALVTNQEEPGKFGI